MALSIRRKEQSFQNVDIHMEKDKTESRPVFYTIHKNKISGRA